MSANHPQVFDSTLQKTNIWLKQLNELLHWDDNQKAYHGLRAVLHVLRDRLPVAEAAHLGAQLPMLVRGFYYDCWKPAATPVKIKTPQEFYDAVREQFATDRNVNPMRLTGSRDEGARDPHLSPGGGEAARHLSSGAALALARE